MDGRSQDWSKLRKAQPANIALPHTKRWFENLPVQVKPRALLAQCPRIANFLAADWNEPNTLHRYLYELLIDRRGNRQGLPNDVMHELLALRAYFEELHPDAIAPWESARKRD